MIHVNEVSRYKLAIRQERQAALAGSKEFKAIYTYKKDFYIGIV